MKIYYSLLCVLSLTTACLGQPGQAGARSVASVSSPTPVSSTPTNSKIGVSSIQVTTYQSEAYYWRDSSQSSTGKVLDGTYACPAGKTLISGGCDCMDNNWSTLARVRASYPERNNDWYCQCEPTACCGGEGPRLRIYVTCATIGTSDY